MPCCCNEHGGASTAFGCSVCCPHNGQQCTVMRCVCRSTVELHCTLRVTRCSFRLGIASALHDASLVARAIAPFFELLCVQRSQASSVLRPVLLLSAHALWLERCVRREVRRAACPLPLAPRLLLCARAARTALHSCTMAHLDLGIDGLEPTPRSSAAPASRRTSPSRRRPPRRTSRPSSIPSAAWRWKSGRPRRRRGE